MSTPAPDVLIRPLREAEVVEASRICRVAFGTFLGSPEPETIWPDKEYIGTRFRAAPEAVLAAEIDGALAGINVASNWGSFAFFGPLAIRPELWNRGIAQKLLAPTMDLFDAWGVREAGLFTFAHSTKHVALYQKFGFWPRSLTAVTAKPVTPAAAVPFAKFSALDEAGRAAAIMICREITGAILDGLDVSGEIRSVLAQSLGDTILVDDESFAVCHCGPGTEAGNGLCYVKFAAARTEKAFERLLSAIESFAAGRGLERIEAGMNLARANAYRAMQRAGYRPQMQGVAMQRADRAGFNRAEVFAIDDWR